MSVIEQYDSEHKRAFYAEVMGDGTDNIHFGKWDGVDTEAPGAYGKASTNMTNWMWSEAMKIIGKPDSANVKYIDLGSGSGSAAAHLCSEHPSVNARCINLCPNQNAENMERAKSLGLDKRIAVTTGTYMEMPKEWEGTFDGCFSQDAFVHAYSKEAGLREALRVTKPGGFLVLCDLHCGDGPDVSAEELHTFAETNMVADWLTPEECVAAAKKAGWDGTAVFVCVVCSCVSGIELAQVGGHSADPPHLAPAFLHAPCAHACMCMPGTSISRAHVCSALCGYDPGHPPELQADGPQSLRHACVRQVRQERNAAGTPLRVYVCVRARDFSRRARSQYHSQPDGQTERARGRKRRIRPRAQRLAR